MQLAADTKTTQAATAPATAGSGDSKAAAEQASFDELYDKASGITEDVKAAQTELDFAHHDETPDKKRIAEIESDLKAKRDEAMAACQQALALPSTATNVDKLNQLRYWLCWFHYAKGNYYDAAALGDFLARKYPKSSGALPGAQVALRRWTPLIGNPNKPRRGAVHLRPCSWRSLANYMMHAGLLLRRHPLRLMPWFTRRLTKGITKRRRRLSNRHRLIRRRGPAAKQSWARRVGQVFKGHAASAR